MIYKVSYVIRGSDLPGAIVNVDEPPHIGDRVTLGRHAFEVVEVLELMPPRGEFNFLRVTCIPIEED